MIYTGTVQCPHCNTVIDIKKTVDEKIAKESIPEIPKIGMVYINWIVAVIMCENPIVVRYGKSRKREVILCRHLSQYMCRQHKYSYQAIADFFLYKTHDGILRNVKAVKNDMLTNKEIRDIITEIELKLKEI